MASEKPRSISSKLIEGSAESIPLDDASVDTVVSTGSRCTIRDVPLLLPRYAGGLNPMGNWFSSNTGWRRKTALEDGRID